MIRPKHLGIALALGTACAHSTIVPLAPVAQRVPVDLLPAAITKATGVPIDSVTRIHQTLRIWGGAGDTAVRPDSTIVKAMLFAVSHDAHSDSLACVTWWAQWDSLGDDGWQFWEWGETALAAHGSNQVSAYTPFVRIMQRVGTGGIITLGRPRHPCEVGPDDADPDSRHSGQEGPSAARRRGRPFS